jgi:hypothetical protein
MFGLARPTILSVCFVRHLHQRQSFSNAVISGVRDEERSESTLP